MANAVARLFALSLVFLAPAAYAGGGDPVTYTSNSAPDANSVAPTSAAPLVTPAAIPTGGSPSYADALQAARAKRASAATSSLNMTPAPSSPEAFFTGLSGTPFSWPAAYLIVSDEQCQGKQLHVTYAVDGLSTKMETKSDHSDVTFIYNATLDQHITVMNGRVMANITAHTGGQTPRPTLAPHPLFPTDGEWETLGPDTVNRKASIKYKVTTETSAGGIGGTFYVWLDPATHAPLQLDSPAYKMTFTTYTAGHPSPSEFLAPQS